MIVPLAARWVAAVCGIFVLLTAWSSVIGTLIVPRPVGSWLTRGVDRVVVATYRLVKRHFRNYQSRDRLLATQAATILITQLLGWLALIFVGYTLLLWPMPRPRHRVRFHRRGLVHLHARLRRAVGYGAGRVRLPRRRPPGWSSSRSRSATCRRCTTRSTGGRPRSRCLTRGAASPPGDRNCSRAPTTRSARAFRRSTRCPSCTELGTLGRGRRGKPQHVPAARPVPLAARSTPPG